MKANPEPKEGTVYRRRCPRCNTMLEFEDTDKDHDDCVTCPSCNTRFSVFAWTKDY